MSGIRSLILSSRDGQIRKSRPLFQSSSKRGLVPNVPFEDRGQWLGHPSWQWAGKAQHIWNSKIQMCSTAGIVMMHWGEKIPEFPRNSWSGWDLVMYQLLESQSDTVSMTKPNILNPFPPLGNQSERRGRSNVSSLLAPTCCGRSLDLFLAPVLRMLLNGKSLYLNHPQVKTLLSVIQWLIVYHSKCLLQKPSSNHHWRTQCAVRIQTPGWLNHSKFVMDMQEEAESKQTRNFYDCIGEKRATGL